MSFFLEPYPKISSHVQFYLTKNVSNDLKSSKKKLICYTRTDAPAKTSSSKEQSVINGKIIF